MFNDNNFALTAEVAALRERYLKIGSQLEAGNSCEAPAAQAAFMTALGVQKLSADLLVKIMEISTTLTHLSEPAQSDASSSAAALAAEMARELSGGIGINPEAIEPSTKKALNLLVDVATDLLDVAAARLDTASSASFVEKTVAFSDLTARMQAASETLEQFETDAQEWLGAMEEASLETQIARLTAIGCLQPAVGFLQALHQNLEGIEEMADAPYGMNLDQESIDLVASHFGVDAAAVMPMFYEMSIVALNTAEKLISSAESCLKEVDNK